MSKLTELKTTVDQIARTARTTGSSLAQFESKFSQLVGEVEAAIGNSAQSADKQVIASLQAASRAVSQASGALSSAAQTASNYAKGL